MRTLSNTLFSLLILLFLLGPVTLYVCQNLFFLDLPTWLTAEKADYLLGDGEEVRIEDHLSLQDFQNKQFQSNLEKIIAKHIPTKANAILSNSQLQRRVIETSNALFNWETYPTFYGSSILIERKNQSLSPTPYASPGFVKEANKGIKMFGKGLAEFASENQDIEISILVAEYREKSAIGSAWNLVTHKWPISDCIAIWSEEMKGANNIQIQYDHFDNYKDYLQYYYKYDEHWNGYGAIHAFNSLAQKINLPNYPSQTTRNNTIESYLFFGSFCRNGRMIPHNQQRLSEPSLKTKNLLPSNNIADAAVYSESLIDAEETSYVKFNFYSWFYGIRATSVITNTEPPNDERVLIICDSFGNAFRWVAAQSCNTTYCNYCLSEGMENDSSLRELVERTNATKIIFVGSIRNFSSFAERNQHFFLTY